jgi:hypothetical protein
MGRKPEVYQLTPVAFIEAILITTAFLTILILLLEIRQMKRTQHNKNMEIKIKNDTLHTQLQFYSSLLKDGQFASLSERIDKLHDSMQTSQEISQEISPKLVSSNDKTRLPN